MVYGDLGVPAVEQQLSGGWRPGCSGHRAITKW